MSDENYWCLHVSLDFLHLQIAVHGLGFHSHHAMLQPIIQVHVVISDKHMEEETAVRFWEQNNYLKSLIPWFWAGVDLGAASWPVTRLESRCESAHCENRTSLVVESFSIDMPFIINMVDCNSWMLHAGVDCWTICGAEKLFYFLDGEVTKNRTLSKPSCQVKRLSKLKPACLMYSYSFVCSVTRRVPSFVHAWLCYVHGCTFLAWLSAIIQPIGIK